MTTTLRLPLCLAFVLGACSGDNNESLSTEIPCDDLQPCPETATCNEGRCVGDGTLVEDDACSDERQCGEGLACDDGVCVSGCVDIYFLDDCTDDKWCKPDFAGAAPGQLPELGSCSPSECDPSTAEGCEAGDACVALSATVGACLSYCEYGFLGSTYSDNCVDSGGLNFACEPMGLNQVPVCIPAGGADAAPLGLPGCDPVQQPCAPGQACVSVVCRQLCTDGQPDETACSSGQSCVSVGTRTDISYCRAE